MKKGFNCEIQADFLTSLVNESNYEIPVGIDLGATYFKKSISPGRDARTMTERFEETWICRHGVSE